MTLHAGVNPGVDKLITQDVVPKVKGAVEGVKNVAHDIRSTVAPSTIDANAHDTALAVRKYKAGSANNAAIEAANGKKANKFFNRQEDELNIANISSYERTGKFENEPVKGYSEIYKASTDYAHSLNQETFGNNEMGKIQNYVRRNWVFGKAADEQKATTALFNYQRSLKPGTSNLKQRTLTMPLDEAQKVLADRGIKAKLVSTNPEVLRQATVAQAEQSAAYKTMGEELKGQGLIKFVRGGNIPEGFMPLNDRAFQVFFPSEAGLTKAGQYMASPSVAKILDNAVSQGLEGNSIFRGLRNVKNNFNLVQLGLSGFHLGTTTINASLNDMVVGMRKLLSGNVGGVKEIGRGFVPGASIVRETYLGSKAFKAFKQGSPEAADVLEKSLNPSGFRLRMENRYKTTVTENMSHAFAQGNIIGGLARVPGSFIEQSTRPIMEHLVPNAKLGAMLDRAKAVQERMPNASDKELASALSKASDSIDNVYGQLVYDNLFWNKSFKDLAMLSQRSVGWNLGTLREVGGGITDVATKTLTGKGVSDKTLYAASLPLLVGLYGATYQYMHTGHGPTELKDYFYPKTGLTDKNGNPDRVAMPSYMKDVVSYGTNPVKTVGNKLSPEFGLVKDLLTNKDYYGNLIRNPNDSKGKQLQQAGQYLLNQGVPFSLRQLNKQKVAGASKEQQGEAFFGLTPAPGYVSKSPLEQKVGDMLSMQLGTKTATPQDALIQKAKQSAREQIATGKGDSQAKALVSSGVLTADKLNDFIAKSKLPALQRNFDLLSIDNKAQIISKATPDQLKQLGDLNALMTDAAGTLNNKNAKQSSKDAARIIIDKLGGNSDDLYTNYRLQQRQKLRDSHLRKLQTAQ